MIIRGGRAKWHELSSHSYVLTLRDTGQATKRCMTVALMNCASGAAPFVTGLVAETSRLLGGFKLNGPKSERQACATS